MKRTRKVTRAKAIVPRPAAQIYNCFLAGIQARLRVAECRLLAYDVKTAPVVQQLKNIVATSEPSDA